MKLVGPEPRLSVGRGGLEQPLARDAEDAERVGVAPAVAARLQ